MPIVIKKGGSLSSLGKGDTRLKVGDAIVSPSSGFVRKSGIWAPIWANDEEPDEGGGSNSPLPPGVPRWGIAQFSDTDFTGGKSDPNMDGKPYDRWSGVQEFIDNELQTYDPSLLIEMDIPFPDYGYFAHKASDGSAQFVDTEYGWPGGWDGAKWEDGGFGSETGPIIVMYDDGEGLAEWKVYRTDFSGIGEMGWNVTIS